MDIRKFNQQGDGVGDVIAMDITLKSGTGIFNDCFANSTRGPTVDRNESALKVLFGDSCCAVKRNGSRPSYRIELRGGIELYANSFVPVREIDGNATGIQEKVLHIGIPGPLIQSTSAQCQAAFEGIENFFKDSEYMRAVQQRKANTLKIVAVVSLVLLACLAFALLKK